MSTKFKNLKNNLSDLEEDGRFNIDSSSVTPGSSGGTKLANYILLFAFIATLTFYAGSKLNFSSIEINPITSFVQELNEPNEELLNGMGSWMEEMGYGTLSREQLIELRREGVTATYTSQMRDMGYTDITLEELVDLQKADVSATFTRMMKELGYELSIEELISLRRNNVTAFFTSNMLNLGYTLEELTTENLERMRSVGVTHNMAERLMASKNEKPTIDELIRYRISNQ